MARPSVPILSRDVIVDAAMHLAATTGDFTMVSLSAHLSVRPSSLYNHVASKAEVINLIRSTWLGELLERAVEVPQGVERIRFMAEGFYARAVEAPNLIPLLFVEPLVEPESLKFYDELAASAIHAGAEHDQLAAIIGLVDAYVLGAALDASAPPFAIADAEAYPHLQATLDAVAARNSRGTPDFLAGLDIISTGLSASLRRAHHIDSVSKEHRTDDTY